MSEKLTRTQIKNLERLGGVNPADQPVSRRQFVRQVGGYGLVAGGAVGCGLLLRDHWGMEGVKPPPPVRLKDYSVALSSSRPNLVVVRSSPVRAEEHVTKEAEFQAREEQAMKMVKAALDAMGGVSHFIRKGIVADNPINNPESCFYKTKVGEAAVRAGAELMLPKDSYFEQLYIGGETITHTWRMFYRPFREATKVIGISPVKDHNLCKATITMKNWYGLLG